MNTYLVVPTIRNLSFLTAWGTEFAACHLIVVEDHEKKSIPTPASGFLSVRHYTWSDIRSDFGRNEWIFPRQNAGIRSYGFWKAYQAGADVIITLDDDCYPAEKDFVEKHCVNLRARAPSDWFATFPHPDYMFTRGFPYAPRNKYRVAISHGLWSNKVDMDAKTQLAIGNVNVSSYPPLRQFVPFGYFFPMSSMNLAFVREVVPLMYFLLMGSSPEGLPWGFDRFDDIWAGLFAKKILDHLGLSVVNGSPFVEHRKASDPHKNLIKEKRGLAVNETLWKAVDAVRLAKTTPAACYRELAEKIVFPAGPYFQKLRKAMVLWSKLF